MKKRALLTLVILTVILAACGNGSVREAPEPEVKETVISLTLYADFSNGLPDGNVEEKMITLPAEKEPASPAVIAIALADALTEWTGLDFFISDISFPDDDSISVDWSKDSTLIAGLDDREFKEDFFFFDAVSLNWFMMDSLAMTLKQNLDVSTVYYHSEGKPITFTNSEDMAIHGLPELPVDQPYEGSPFFVGHAGGRGY